MTAYLILSTLYYLPLHPLPSGNHHNVGQVYNFLFVCFSCLFICCFPFYTISHMSEIMWFFTFSVWLLLLSVIFSGSIHVVPNGTARVWRHVITSRWTCMEHSPNTFSLFPRGCIMGSVWKRRPPSLKTSSVSTAAEDHTAHLLRAPQGFLTKRVGGAETLISKRVKNSKGWFCKVMGAARAFCFWQTFHFRGAMAELLQVVGEGVMTGPCTVGMWGCTEGLSTLKS